MFRTEIVYLHTIGRKQFTHILSDTNHSGQNLLSHVLPNLRCHLEVQKNEITHNYNRRNFVKTNNLSKSDLVLKKRTVPYLDEGNLNYNTGYELHKSMQLSIVRSLINKQVVDNIKPLR